MPSTKKVEQRRIYIINKDEKSRGWMQRQKTTAAAPFV
jgi:hypothetical protein